LLNRPFFGTRIEALERQFDENRDDRAFLKTLVAELKYRDRRRADELRRRAAS
jgi:RNA binding exosome subunit